MAISSGFFDSVDGDRLYDADQMSTYFEGLISDGVYENVGDKFLVTAASGLSVSVGSGRAIVRSHWIKNSEDASLSLDAADIQNPRIDAIALRLDAEARTVSLVVKKGTPAATPVIPAITRTETVYELYIASVLIERNASAVSSITDLRPSSYCGWVTGIIKQVDTSELFLQWQTAYERQFAAFDSYMQQKQAEFNAWLHTLTSQLVVDTTIVKYESVVTTAGGSAGALINIDEYNPNTDILLVHVNGLYLTEGVDYEIVTIPALHKSSVTLIPEGREFSYNDKISLTVLKNVPAGSITAPVNALAVATGFQSGIVANATQIIEEG